jgi:putative superfamily III holin-X
VVPIMATPNRELDVRNATTPSLFAAVLDDARELAIGHLERMQRETAEELRNLKRAIARTAGGAAIAVVGTLLAGHALALVLVALGLPPWAGYAIVAALAIIGGALEIRRWPKDSKDLDLYPEESIAQLKHDISQVKDAAREG